MISGHHAVNQAQIAFFMTTHDGLVLCKALFHLFAVRPDYYKIEHCG
jgi:hypothetical protein